MLMHAKALIKLCLLEAVSKTIPDKSLLFIFPTCIFSLNMNHSV